MAHRQSLLRSLFQCLTTASAKNYVIKCKSLKKKKNELRTTPLEIMKTFNYFK